jgi:hypothetical protein
MFTLILVRVNAAAPVARLVPNLTKHQFTHCVILEFPITSRSLTELLSNQRFVVLKLKWLQFGTEPEDNSASLISK